MFGRPTQVVDHIMQKYKYHEHPHREVQFALAVQCFAHYCAVCATRVYLACLVPTAEKKEKVSRFGTGKANDEAGREGG